MGPVGAVSTARSADSLSILAPVEANKQKNKIVETIPIVEPMPHYPLSATVSEMITHINELISEQRESAQEALRDQHREQFHEEMARLLDAAKANAVNSAEKAPVNSFNQTDSAKNTPQPLSNTDSKDESRKSGVTADFPEANTTQKNAIKDGQSETESEAPDQTSDSRKQDGDIKAREAAVDTDVTNVVRDNDSSTRSPQEQLL